MGKNQDQKYWMNFSAEILFNSAGLNSSLDFHYHLEKYCFTAQNL